MPSTIRGSDNFDSAGGNAVKAWVNFNGTGTVAIRAAFNVSSITDNGTGDYTVNFTSALADANYGFSMSCTTDSSSQRITNVVGSGQTTSSIRVSAWGAVVNTNVDPSIYAVAVYR